MFQPPIERAKRIGQTQEPAAAVSEASESTPGAASGSGSVSKGSTGASEEAPFATKARGPCLDTQAPTIAPSGDPSVEVPQPLRISAYKILSVLGEGGMGVVYRAEQDNPRREVALKLLKAGGASVIALSRFREEGQILGRLQHPGIAQIFEAGTADTGFGPQPFFAMEFVHGVPLQAYVDSNRLSLRSRLELMIKVCQGVHHAHQKGVIHRDLKPGNILVDESGQPKILDFGIALLADRDGSAAERSSEQRQLLGTVPYMSIEQFSGDPHEIDTRSDVYSLGVILYQLLAGRLPFDLRDKTIPQARHVVDEQEPTPLGVLNRTCRGDLESIVGKALAREKVGRYQSASDLAADLRRHLNDEPVLARVPSRFYLLQKFAKRNRVLLGSACLVLVVLVVALILTTRQWAKAIDEAERSNLASTLLMNIIESADPRETTGANMFERMVSAVNAAASGLATGKLNDRPSMEAEVHHTLGKAYLALGKYDRASLHLEEARVKFESVLGPEHLKSLESTHDLARLLRARGMLAEAEDFGRHTLDTHRRVLGPEHPMTLEAMQNLGAVFKEQGKYAEAESLFRQALQAAAGLLSPDEEFISYLRNDLAIVLKHQDKIAEAERLYELTLARQECELPTDHPLMLTTKKNLAELYVQQGRLEEAESLLRKTWEALRGIVGPDHPDTLRVVNTLASLCRKQGSLVEAEELFTRVLEVRRSKLGEKHPETMSTMHNLASLLQDSGELEKAEQIFRRVLSMRLAKLGPDHPSVFATRNNLAGLLKERRKLDEAESLYRDILDAYRRAGNEDSDHAQKARHNLACVLHDQGKEDEDEGKLQEAERYYRQSLDYYQRKFGDEHLRTTTMKFGLAKLLADMGDDTGAAELHREVLETRRKRFPGREPDIARSLFELGDVYLRLGNAVRTEAWLRESLAIRRKHFASDDYRTANAENGLGASLAAQGRFDEAETLLVPSLPIIESRYGAEGKRTKTARQRLAKLYLAWDATEPGKGYGQQAAEWRAKLP